MGRLNTTACVSKTRSICCTRPHGPQVASQWLCSTYSPSPIHGRSARENLSCQDPRQSACPWHVVAANMRIASPPGRQLRTMLLPKPAADRFPPPDAFQTDFAHNNTRQPFRSCICIRHHPSMRRRAHHCLAVCSLAIQPVLLGPHSPTTAFRARQGCRHVLRLADLARHRSPHRRPQWFPC